MGKIKKMTERLGRSKIVSRLLGRIFLFSPVVAGLVLLCSVVAGGSPVPPAVASVAEAGVAIGSAAMGMKFVLDGWLYARLPSTSRRTAIGVIVWGILCACLMLSVALVLLVAAARDWVR
jgi:hypothetical protein